MNWEEIKSFFGSLTLQRLLPTLLVLGIGFLTVKLLLRLFDKLLSRSKLDRSMFGVLRSVMTILLYALVLLIALSSLGVDVTSLVALLSVLSLAISLSVQSALANFFGSVTILATHPYRVGDYIEIGTDGGTVEEIGMSYTSLLTADGKRIYIPNSDAAAARVCNYSAEGKRRVELNATASYDDPIDAVKEALLSIVPYDKLLDGTQPEVYVNAYLDSSVQYLLRFWVKDADYWPVRFDVTEQIKREFDRRGITIPFPQTELRVKTK